MHNAGYYRTTAPCILYWIRATTPNSPCALIDEITIQPRANEMERKNVLSALAFYREMANFLQSGLPQMPYPLQPNPTKTNRKQV